MRQRIIRELESNSSHALALFEIWQAHFRPLLDRVNAPDAVAAPETWLPLRKQYGAAALQYALYHASKEEIRACAETVAALPAATGTVRERPPAVPPPPATYS